MLFVYDCRQDGSMERSASLSEHLLQVAHPPSNEGVENEKRSRSGMEARVQWQSLRRMVGLWQSLRKMVGLWWETTTDEDYLQSDISRRKSWGWVLPIFNVFGLVCDLAVLCTGSFDTFPIVLIDIAFLGYACFWLHTPFKFKLTGIQLDFLLSAGINAIWILMTSNAAARDGGSDQAGDFIVVIVVQSCLGFHSTTALMTLALSVVAQFITGNSLANTINLANQATYAAVSAIVLEFCIASLYKDLQAQASCNQHLLDFATDGFGVVDVEGRTWRLTQVSSKMAESLGRSEEQLLGTRLDEVVHKRDRASLNACFAAASQDSPTASACGALVTVETDALEFEVRLVPYMMQRTASGAAQVGFCIQIVGEKRSASKLSQAAIEAAGGATPPPPPPLPPRGVSKTGPFVPPGAAAGGSSDVDLDRHPESPLQKCSDEDGTPHSGSPAEDSGADRVASALNRHVAKEASRNPPPRALGTLSLSSWTGTLQSVAVKPTPKRDVNSKKKSTVEMKTVATQTLALQRKARPPAPLAVATYKSQQLGQPVENSSALHGLSSKVRRYSSGSVSSDASASSSGTPGPSASQRGNSRERDQRPVFPDVLVDEGRPAISRFLATPKRTRGMCLNNIARSFNIAGFGCCAKHIGYMALYEALREELRGPCGNLLLHADWQCTACLCLNKWHQNEDAEAEDGLPSSHDQVCMICGTVGTGLHR
eukprot:CAMPEP_0178375218 /NCGR_PEP_ID=MMETSP0689_2-20121128/2773_1 /TAXON_ID=160604 /ORGANISM="Amphidinium massartii, Strain CS-259" /LENGTH=710 /DNA_ID=CAMNT_0019995201 /DNA_START=23 /DNA_END=2155 /DNA_ORIENTATION=+